MPIKDDDLSQLTEGQRSVVLRVRAAQARGAEREARGQQTLAADKQSFPIGIKDDGTLNSVSE